MKILRTIFEKATPEQIEDFYDGAEWDVLIYYVTNFDTSFESIPEFTKYFHEPFIDALHFFQRLVSKCEDYLDEHEKL